MLNVYAADWCPHCQKTVKFLKENNIRFNYIDLEAQPDDVVAKVVEANDGVWVVPTMEYNGKWRKGKAFDTAILAKDLVTLGVVDQEPGLIR